MHIVSYIYEMLNPIVGDNLHQMSDTVLWGNKKKYHQFVSYWNYPEIVNTDIIII